MQLVPLDYPLGTSPTQGRSLTGKVRFLTSGLSQNIHYCRCYRLDSLAKFVAAL
jgi:hypothetical protein